MDTEIVLIGDVQGSRDAPDFPAHRDRALRELSRRHRHAGWTDVDYAVSTWDEFQGMLADPVALPRVLWDIYRAFQPLRVRLAVGGGAVERLDDGGAINRSVTGEAFYLAREALEELSARRHGSGRVRLAVAWNDPAVAASLNAALRLVDVLSDEITATQWEVIGHYESLGHQGEVARVLDKSESTISRSLAAARYWEIQASLGDLETFLKNCTNKSNNTQLHREEHLWL